MLDGNGGFRTFFRAIRHGQYKCDGQGTAGQLTQRIVERAGLACADGKTAVAVAFDRLPIDVPLGFGCIRCGYAVHLHGERSGLVWPHTGRLGRNGGGGRSARGIAQLNLLETIVEQLA